MRRLLLLLALAIIGGCDGDSTNPADVKGHAGFLLSDYHMGEVLKADAREDVGKKFTFVGLKTGKQVRVVSEDGGYSVFTKAFDSDEVITLILVGGGSGSVDAYVIDKKTGTFARAEAGVYIKGVAAFGSVGRCAP